MLSSPQQYEQQYEEPVYEDSDIKSVSTLGGMNADSINAQIDNREIIRRIEFDLRGYSYDWQTGNAVKIGDPLINKVGLQRLLMLLSSHMDKNSRVSDLDDEEIYNMVLDLWFSLCDFCYEYRVDYNIKNSKLIKRSVINPIFSNLKASKQGRQLDAITQMQKIMQTIGGNQKKGGMFSKWLNFK